MESNGCIINVQKALKLVLKYRKQEPNFSCYSNLSQMFNSQVA